jgi:NitT/TauT family transport system substrate-binding protein
MHKLRLLLGVALVVAVVGAGIGTATVSAETTSLPKTIQLATGFRPDVLFTPFYVAQDLGYYKKAGLNVQINYDRVSNLMQAVAQGKYTFAATGGDTAVIGRANGADVQYVMAQYQKYPVGAMWLKSGGPKISKPADLKGLNIGISIPGSSTDYGLTALLEAGKISRSDVKVTAIGFTETEALINHQIDVAMTFVDNEPVQADALGHPVNTMLVSNFVRLIGPGLVTSSSNVKHHPGFVRSFVKASLQGLQYTLRHPDAAFQVAMKRMPEVTGSAQIAVQRKVLAARLAFQVPVKGKPLGWVDPTRWAGTIAFLKRSGTIPADVKPNQAFTNGFVNAINLKP